MGEIRLRILRVERTAMHATARWATQYHGNRRSPAKVRLGQQVGDLVEGATDEVHELKLSHRTHAGERGAKAAVDDGHLRDGGVHHARRTERSEERRVGAECRSAWW